MFENAIVRFPGENFADGLTTVDLGKPVFAKALAQHAAYCTALERCGLRLIALPADLEHPDSTFVEDAAILTRDFAILTRPGAKEREGEVAAIGEVLRQRFRRVHQIRSPGTLDGGDICEAGTYFFIGISRRTNEEGGRQLAAILSQEGFTSSFVDIRGMDNILHLKSGIAYIGENQLVVMDSMADLAQFQSYKIIRVAAEESYAANCVRVNDFVLFPSGFPHLESSLKQLGYKLCTLDMSEFQKMDGGLSCLSLRF